MDLVEWLGSRGGIAHRDAAKAAGFGTAAVRECAASGRATIVRRWWVAVPGAPAVLRAAAEAGGRITCASLARWRGWWMPDDVDQRLHLSLTPGARAPSSTGGVRHWTRPIAPPPALALVEAPENALAHIASCLPREAALIVWESAIRVERLDIAALRQVTWTSIAARECAQSVNGLSDSGLETIAVRRLLPWGLPIRQQIVLAGHPVDLLIAERLVVQLDGFEFHSTPAQRARDAAHDAELRLRGYTVLRFTYAQVVHDWPAVERTIARAVAAGAHRAA